MLDCKHANRAFAANYGHAGEAVEAFFAGFRAIGEGRVAVGFGKVEDAAFGGNRANQAFAHRQPCDVHGFLAKAVCCGQLQLVVSQEVDRADFALHRFSDQVDDMIELGLRRGAPRHQVVQPGQDFAGGLGSGQGHAAALSESAALIQDVAASWRWVPGRRPPVERCRFPTIQSKREIGGRARGCLRSLHGGRCGHRPGRYVLVRSMVRS